jgi:tetratricopeptide (TPR) repeat protein
MIRTNQELLRPQPVGILPIPAGLLLLPDAGETGTERMKMLMQGATPSQLPPAWSFYESASAGDMDSALLDLAGDDTDVASYNRFVLAPSPEGWVALRQSVSGPLANLIGVAAYTAGLTDEIPETGALDGELLAIVLMTQAAAELEQDAVPAAIGLLREAVQAAKPLSPIFAVQLLAQLASVCRAQPEPIRSETRDYLREAVACLEALNKPDLVSDLWMQLGMACQDNAQGRESWMTEAVAAYQQVLRGGLVPEEHRELFALAHNNLGLLFLTMPMREAGKQLRMGTAVQSFREALRLCDRAVSPDLWASIQSNLANALQYLPSSHPEENLVQAVELYEELVSVGRKAFDPVGYGKILSNQANALAHLGIFSSALEKLQEARKLFEWHDEPELASNALTQVEKIHEQIGVSRGRA